MSGKVYLGIDLGAESGRVMAGLWNGREMAIEEIHRFPNGAVSVGGTLRWDLLRLWGDIQKGLALAARRFGKNIVSVGVDTWGVDFVLLSRSGELLGLPFHYRDARTDCIMEEAFRRVPRAEIFAASGLQFMQINTLYQLLALQKSSPEILEAADRFLMIPDFLNWCLCGSTVLEFTNATTTQCVHPRTRGWSFDLLRRFHLPVEMFPEIVPPGTRLERLRPAVAETAGIERVPVIAPATHDTGSAVVGVPTEYSGRASWAYLSSGTWSLLGVEVTSAVLTERALALNLTNEGGVDGTYRLLKNIMGLWIVQQCRRAFESRGRNYDYAELVKLAAAAPALQSFVDPDDPRFFNAPDMPEAIREFCRGTGQTVPDTDGAVVRCAFESLALKYRMVLGWIEEASSTPVELIHIVGGGSRNALLNQFAADACGRPVLAGPVESTVLGNVLVQARADGELHSLHEMRMALRGSERPAVFEPREQAAWADAWDRFRRLVA